MSITISSIRPKEESSLVAVIKFTDAAKTPIAPISATWTLTDLSKNVINSRQDVTISSLGTSATIVLSGDDLVCQPIDKDDAIRALGVEWIYNSTEGNNLPGKAQIGFTIERVYANMS